MNPRASWLLLAVAALVVPGAALAQRTRPLIVDHTSTEIGPIPVPCIDRARSLFRLSYGHTSHGSQLVSGMDVLAALDPAHYGYSYDGTGGTLSIWDYTPSGDLGNPDRVTWEQLTRDMLGQPASDRNLVMWSWCGQVSTATEADITTYLTLMSGLERDFPDVTFVYMTGHLDGTGETGNLHLRNNQIRDFCRAGNKVLFDFADIESYDPEGIYYVDRGANDNCDYDTGNWAIEWCNAHPGECSTVGCAHSQSLNCDRKGRAFWWMLVALSLDRLGECIDPAGLLKVKKSGDDALLRWDSAPGTDAWNVWYVTDARDSDLARWGEAAAIGVNACVPPASATVPACTDAGALTRSPATFFYQVRPFCCRIREGP